MSSDPPATLDSWIRVGPPLGTGGQAVVYRVYKARDPDQRPFVAKVLKEWDPIGKAASEDEQFGRFKREVLALESLASTGCPKIVPVIDKQLDPPQGMRPWYVMPFYAGGPMARAKVAGVTYAEAYKGNVDRVLEIAGSVAVTLAWMHENEPQYIHRDVHMGNIFFERVDGAPILGDFGLVHVHAEGPFKTGGREPLGPWQWRPPELRPGSADKANPKADVYLLGGVIYEALSGGLIIEETEQVGGRFTHEQPDYDLAQFTNDLRIKHVTSLLRNMLARDPRARMTAREVTQGCQAIRNWRAGGDAPVILAAALQLEQAAAIYRQRGEAYRNDVIVQHLLAVCESVARQISIIDTSEPYHFVRSCEATAATVARSNGSRCATLALSGRQ